MRVRIRFSKFGCARFLGHLDLMRYFQKAFRRAKLPLAFSEGYHPHPILSFAQPLSLSYTSDGEYFDMELTMVVPVSEIFERLQAAMCDEVRLNKVSALPDYVPQTKKVTGMSLITGAMYAISLENMPEDIEACLRRFMELKEYTVVKTTKNGTKDCNLREGVYDLYLYDNGSETTIYESGSFDYSKEERAQALTNANLYHGRAILVTLDAGSERNISADMFLKGILSYGEYGELSCKKAVHRMDLFGNYEERKVPLWKIEL